MEYAYVSPSLYENLVASDCNFETFQAFLLFGLFMALNRRSLRRSSKTQIYQEYQDTLRKSDCKDEDTNPSCPVISKDDAEQALIALNYPDDADTMSASESPSQCCSNALSEISISSWKPPQNFLIDGVEVTYLAKY